MNGALLAAALVALNPNFIGNWCTNKGEIAITFTTEEYVEVFGGSNEGCSLGAKRAADPNQLFGSMEPMIYSAAGTFQTEYLLCGNGELSLSHLGVKFTLSGKDTIQEWDVFKNGTSTPTGRKLFRCDFEEDY